MFFVHHDVADVVMHFLFTQPAHASDFANMLAEVKSNRKIKVVLMMLNDFKVVEAYCFWHERSPVE